MDTKYAGSGIRTLEPLRDRDLNPAPLARLGNPRVDGVLSILAVDMSVLAVIGLCGNIISNMYELK